MSNKLIVGKPGIDVLSNTNPKDHKFNSDYGTLKYFQKVNRIATLDAGAGDITCRNIYTHGLGYYPFVEVFVRVYIGSPFGNYEYVPFAGSGASVAYSANFRITPTELHLYGEINGISGSIWTFDFLLFLYKNNLGL